MAAMDGRRAQATSPGPMGLMGSSVSHFSSNSPPRLLSASLVGQGLGGRARPTTQEIIAEAFGRRLHGLELLSVKKLNALNASAAKLEAHVASRAAAISRTSVATTEAGFAIGPGCTGLGKAAAAVAAASSMSAGGAGADHESTTQQALSPVISVAFPATLIGGSPGQATQQQQQQQQHNVVSMRAKPVAHAPEDISERGTQVVRLLALQDKILHGALGNTQQQQQSLVTSPSSQSQSQLQLTLLSPTTGIRFTTLPLTGEQGAGSAATEEQRKLDALGIKYDSKVAAETIKLFRLSPITSGDPRPQSQDGTIPSTPPNSHRESDNLDNLTAAEECSEAMRGELSAGSRRQLARSREFSTMARFIQSLQDGDEVSLAQQARSLARLNSSAPSHSQQGLSSSRQHSPSRAATAPVALPALSPNRSQTYPPQSESQSPSRPHLILADTSPKPYHSTVEAKAGFSGTPPHKHLTLDVPETPILGTGPGSSLIATGPLVRASGHSPPRTSASWTRNSNSQVVSPSGKGAPPLQQDLDLGSMPTGQSRSSDLLDGLMKAVEMFVGLGGASSASTPRPGTRVSRQSTKGPAAASGGRELSFEKLPGGMAALDDLFEGEIEGNPQPPISPYSGVYGTPEKLTDRVRKKASLAALTNPAGFREEVAAGEVAMYREVAQRCREALARSTKHPRDAMMAAELHRKVANLHYCRPYFVTPTEPPTELMVPLRPASACSASRQNTHFVQSASAESVFLPRAEETESEDMVDTNAIRESQVRKDWNRVVRKDAFRTMVGVEDPGAASGTIGLGHSLDACMAVIMRHKDSMRAVLTYYSMQANSINDYCFALGLHEWRAFIADCGFGGQSGESGRRSATPSTLAAGVGVAAATGGAAGAALAGRPSATSRGSAAAQMMMQQQQAAATAANASGPGGQRGTKGPANVAAGRVSMAGGGNNVLAGSRMSMAGGAGNAAPGAVKPAMAGGVMASMSVRQSMAGGVTMSMLVRQSMAGGATGGGNAPSAKGRLQGVVMTEATGGPGGGVGAKVSIASRAPSQMQGLATAANAALTGSGGAISGVSGGGLGGGGGGASSSQQSNQLADSVFSAVNVEPEKRIVDGQVALNRSLLRFEWYESLLRLATIRHVKGGEKFGSIAAALEHMWTREVLPVLLPVAVHEPNMWRIVRLYGDPEVNELFITHMDVVTALYGLFSAASKNKRMHMSDWIGLLNTCSLIGDVTGVTLHAAKLAYSRSLTVVVDDTSQWSNAVCLRKCDFMEALGRLAEELAPPPLEEVAEALREVGITGRRLRVALEQPWTYYYNELPVELLVARRIAAAEAAAARSTTTGEESALPSLQNSTTRFEAAVGLGLSAGPGPSSASGRSAIASKGSPPGVSLSGGLAAAAATANPTAASGPPSVVQHAGASMLSPAPPSSWNSLPKLSFRLEALLELMFGRLRDHWECTDNHQLTVRLQATAISLRQATGL